MACAVPIRYSLVSSPSLWELLIGRKRVLALSVCPLPIQLQCPRMPCQNSLQAAELGPVKNVPGTESSMSMVHAHGFHKFAFCFTE